MAGFGLICVIQHRRHACTVDDGILHTWHTTPDAPKPHLSSRGTYVVEPRQPDIELAKLR
jgi:hypothetical protein